MSSDQDAGPETIPLHERFYLQFGMLGLLAILVGMLLPGDFTDLLGPGLGIYLMYLGAKGEVAFWNRHSRTERSNERLETLKETIYDDDQ